MALLPNVFQPEEHESDPFAPVPGDWYEAELRKSTMTDTKDKKGKFLACKFVIVEGDFKDRILWTNLNLINKSEVAVRIANADLKGMCDAVGFEGELEDTEDLHDQPMMIKVTIKPETSQWPAKNEIKAYKSIEEFESMDNPLD